MDANEVTKIVREFRATKDEREWSIADVGWIANVANALVRIDKLNPDRMDVWVRLEVRERIEKE
jgi:hypothetical protein